MLGAPVLHPSFLPRIPLVLPTTGGTQFYLICPAQRSTQIEMSQGLTAGVRPWRISMVRLAGLLSPQATSTGRSDGTLFMGIYTIILSSRGVHFERVW